MAKPIVIPPVQTVADQMREIMRDPRVRRAVKKNPKLAAQIRMRLEAQAQKPGRPMGRGGAYTPGLFRQPSPTTWFHGAPVMVEGETSLAAVVRAQRDAFLVDDGMQVAGDYTDAIRKQAGGRISPPEMPPVGYAAANYKYPSDAMRTGAALGRVRPQAAMFTQTRKPLPTASFYPGAFVAARPDSINRSLVVNKPVPVKRETVRNVRAEYRRDGIITSSPSDDRRRVISTLMGLGAAGKTFSAADQWKMVRGFFELSDTKFAKSKIGGKVRPFFNKFFKYLDDRELTDDEKKALDQSSTGNKILEYVKDVGRLAGQQVIMLTLLANTIDFNDPVMKASIGNLPGIKGKDLNQIINDWVTKLVGPEWDVLVKALGAKFPLSTKLLGYREGLIKHLYWYIWGKSMPDEVYAAVSAKLGCGQQAFGASVQLAMDVMAKPEYAPDKKPKVETCPGVEEFLPPPPDAPAEDTTTSGGGTPPAAETPANMTAVKVGVFGGIALLAVGIYARVR